MNKLSTVKNIDELLTALKAYIKSTVKKIVKTAEENIEASGKYATPQYVDREIANIDLTDYVKKTDYARRGNIPGIVKLDAFSYMSQNIDSSQGLRLETVSADVI